LKNEKINSQLILFKCFNKNILIIIKYEKHKFSRRTIIVDIDINLLCLIIYETLLGNDFSNNLKKFIYKTELVKIVNYTSKLSLIFLILHKNVLFLKNILPYYQ